MDKDWGNNNIITGIRGGDMPLQEQTSTNFSTCYLRKSSKEKSQNHDTDKLNGQLKKSLN
jgi:hypothetical protein